MARLEAPELEFTEEFDVEKNMETSDWATYRRFIEKLRNRLREEGRFSHNRPILPRQENPPTRWFDIVLQTHSRQIRLRIRRGNLYLDGYQMHKSDQWLEFGRDTTGHPSEHLIIRSTFLGFDGGYVALQDVAKRQRENIELSQKKFTAAVNELATSTRAQERARCLIVVIQMICESIRFDRISIHLACTFKKDLPPPMWMLALENGWGDLSAALLREDADPLKSFRLPQPNAMEIVSAQQAADALGILLRTYSPHSALERAPPMAINPALCLQGRPLVEVFSMRINRINEKNPADLYGTVTVTDGLGSQYIYNRKRGDPESIQPLDTILLTGPARSFSAYGSFTIEVALMDRGSVPSLDHEISSGQIPWNIFHTTNEYDKPLHGDVTGKYGSTTVNYIVLSDAVEATVEVVLENGGGKNPADVYGLLTARSGNFSDESVLFQKTSDKDVDVSPGQVIPLSRSVVAVPLKSSLIVRADLYDRNKDPSPNKEIAKGIAEFPAQLSGTSEKKIFGKYCEIQVKVTWMKHL